MKAKLILLGLLLGIGMIAGSVTRSNASGANYEPIIEWCCGGPNVYLFTMACLPGGTQTCQREFCNGQIM